MSELSDALSVGFNALAAVGGDALTYGQESVTGIVNRDLIKLRNSAEMSGPGRKPDFSLQGMTAIEVMKDEMDATPAAGGHFVEVGKTTKHRVEKVIDRGHTWFCYCQPFTA